MRANRHGYRQLQGFPQSKENKSKKSVHHIRVNEALRLYGDKARDTILQEMNQLVTKEVFSPFSDSTDGVTIIPCSAFLKEKYDANGNFVKLKGRIVAGGHIQKRNENISPSSPLPPSLPTMPGMS